MHELAIAQNILDIAAQYVSRGQAADVRTVRVRIGTLSGVVPDSLEFCFGAITAGTPWQAAKLEITQTAARGECHDCGRGFGITDVVFVCPSCGSAEVRLVSGMDLQVVEIDLADEPTEVS
jgi:hydrogenase nickel incorporation protein HypA/HybF